MAARHEDYILEFITVGSAVRVSAVDPVSGEEVTIQGPADAGREVLSRTAIRKLEYVLAKKGLL